MTQKELDKILELHKKWLNKKKDGVRADLRRGDLRRTDLREVDLRGTDLRGADLCRADLRGADLRNTYLYGADLCRADLRGTDLRGADLREVDLRGADLSGAVLSGVLYNEVTVFFALQCPEEGSFIAYKKVNNVIIKLEVPADAKRSSATTRKCRCSKAKVLGFYDFNRNELDIEEITNNHYVTTIYHKGEIVYPDKWDDDRWNDCSNGIHFFMTFDEAKNYW